MGEGAFFQIDAVRPVPGHHLPAEQMGGNIFNTENFPQANTPHPRVEQESVKTNSDLLKLLFCCTITHILPTGTDKLLSDQSGTNGL